jgi:single-strand DNA-binding protein
MSFFRGHLQGNLGRDPETFDTKSGTGVRLSVAVKDGYGDDAKTLWVKVAMFGKRGETVAKQFVKGSGIILFGREIKIEEFTGRDGKQRAALAMIADDFDFPMAGKSADGNSGNGGSSNSGGSRSAAPARSSRQSAPPPPPVDDDDVPF